MARSLKLDCITLRVYRKGTEDTLYFDEFFQHKDEKGKITKRPFADFFSAYVQSFNGKFASVGTAGKSLNLKSKNLQAKLRSRTIYGVVEGGNSGARVDVVDVEDAENVLFSMQPGHVGSEPFHFMLWMPVNFEIGILLLQGYANASLADAFKKHLTSFFRRQCPNATLSTGAYVGPTSVSKFRSESVIDKITIRRNRIKPDVAEHLIKGLKIQTDNAKVNVEVKISGLNTVAGFAELMQTWFADGAILDGLIDIEDLEPVGLDDEAETIIGYKDKDGRQVSAKKGKSFEIKPVLYIDPQDVSIKADGRPEPAQMKAFMAAELERIKDEIGYNNTVEST